MTQRSRSIGWFTWSSLGLGGYGLAQFLLLAVLARHLSAGEFGVVTAGMIVVGVLRTLFAGIAPALVQRSEYTEAHVRSAAALALWFTLGAAAGAFVLAPMLARSFAMPELTEILRGLSLLFLVQSPGLVAEALLQREMRMRALAVTELTSVSLGLLPVGIGAAVAGAGAWALVYAYLAHAAVKATLLAWVRPHARSIWPQRRAATDLLGFGGGVTAARLCNEAASQGDNLVISTFLSAAMLGVYSRAYQLMAMPAMFLGEVIDRVTFPILARSQHDRHELLLGFRRGSALVASITLPASALGIACAPEIVLLVLGKGWSDVVAPFQVLTAGLVLRTGYKISDMLARATGRVYRRAWRQAVFAALVFVLAYAGSAYGLTGVAAGVLGALLVNYVMMAQLSCQTVGMPMRDFAQLHARGAIFAALVLGVAHLTAARLRDAEISPIVVLGGSMLAAASVLAAALALSGRLLLGPDERWLLSILQRRGSPSIPEST